MPKRTYVRSGGTWVDITSGAAFPASSVAPATPVTGQVYFDTDDQKPYIYNGSAFVLFTPALSDSTSTTSSTVAASATAVKAAYDAAAAKVASVTAGSARVTIGGTATAPTVDVAAATTSVAGIVALSDSTSTTSSTVAASATAVKAAYDRGSLGVADAATAQSAADSAQTTANNAVAKSVVDAKGDLIVGTADNTVAKLTVGATDGHVLTVDATTATGIKWAATSGGAGSGDVAGPASSVDNALPRFDSTTGKIIQGSSVIVNDGNVVFHPAATAYSTSAGSFASNTLTLDLSTSDYFVLGSNVNSTAVSQVTTSSFTFTTATTGTVTMPTSPSAPVAGDLIIVYAFSDGGLPASTTSGWTQLLSLGTDAFLSIFYQVVGGTAPSNLALTGLATASGAILEMWRGTGGIDFFAYNAATTGMPQSPAVVTNFASQYVLIGGFLDDDTVTFTAPAGYSGLVTRSVATQHAGAIAYKQVTNAGTTETPAVWGGGQTDANNATTILLSPGMVTLALTNAPTQAISGYGTANARTVAIRVPAGHASITWPASVAFQSGTSAPQTGRAYTVILTTTNGGTSYIGTVIYE